MKRKRGSKRALFNPDKVATAISQNLYRDLSSATQMYGGGNWLQEFFSEAQRSCTLKKYDSTASDEGELEREAFKAFLSTNSRMREVNRKFRAPRDIPHVHLTPIELMLKRARALVHWTLRDITWGELTDHANHSGGVTRGVSFSDTSLEAKFTWPMSCTQEVASYWEQFKVDCPRVAHAVAQMNHVEESELPLPELDLVDASRATTVPKDSRKRRMIAIEPTLNMFFQQGLMAVMYKRLRGVGLDVESLPYRHQDLAWRGSVSGNLATIDFSSASDCVSIELLRYLLPPQWFAYVTTLRCPNMNISGETVELNMVSTMGNAGTFPLETLAFWSIGVATVMQRTRSNPNSLLSLPEERDMVSVFGDDCILPTVDAEAFMAYCVDLGFIVNKEKSFFDSSPGFRESCGGDYFHGSNVRPLYIKAPTSTRKSALEPWLYVILNAVLKKYESYFGQLTYIYEKALLEYLFGLFRKHKLKVKLVPADFPDDAGLKTRDWRRIDRCYKVPWDRVMATDAGWASFRYCRFVYKDDRARDDYLRYVVWLRRPTVSVWWQKPKPKPLFPIRRRGGYVVARGLGSIES